MARFRLVVDMTFPEDDDLPFGQIQAALGAKFEDVSIREAESVGPEDNYGEWRAGWKRDIGICLSSGTSFLFGVSYPVPPVDADELARVWEVLAQAERGQLRDLNVAIAIGRVLRPESDAMATIARATILRRRIPGEMSREIFERAASVPIENEPFE